MLVMLHMRGKKSSTASTKPDAFRAAVGPTHRPGETISVERQWSFCSERESKCNAQTIRGIKNLEKALHFKRNSHRLSGFKRMPSVVDSWWLSNNFRLENLFTSTELWQRFSKFVLLRKRSHRFRLPSFKVQSGRRQLESSCLIELFGQ